MFVVALDQAVHDQHVAGVEVKATHKSTGSSDLKLPGRAEGQAHDCPRVVDQVKRRLVVRVPPDGVLAVAVQIQVS